MKKNTRDCNFELLRIISMLMIVMHHYVVHSDFINQASSLNKLIAMTFSVGGKVGVNLFIMISGYYILESKVKIKKLIKLVFEVYFYSILILIVVYLIEREAISIKTVIKNILPITYALYWFVTPYIWLYIISPYITKFIKILEQKEYKKLLMIMTIALTIIPTIMVKSTTIMSNFVWFVYLYLLAVYIKLFGISLLAENRKVKKYIIGTLVILIFVFAISITFIKNVQTIVEHLTSMNSIFSLIMSLAIFMYFKNMDIKENKLILFLSNKSFAVYLLHDNPLIRNFLWMELLRNNQKYNMNSIVLILDIILTSIIIYILGSMIEYIRIELLEKKIFNNKYVKFIEEKSEFMFRKGKIMEEISLKELLQIFWKKRLQIILIIVAFVVIGLIYSFWRANPPEFESTTTLLLATNSPEDIIETELKTLNSKLIATYSEIAKSNKVLEKVISNLQIDVDVRTIRNGVSVTTVTDTEIIKISVRNQDSILAAKVANETAKVFIETIKEFYGLQNVYIVDEAQTAQSPIGINYVKNIVIFTFLGIIIAAIYVFAANMLEEPAKTEEDSKKKPDVINLEIHLND